MKHNEFLQKWSDALVSDTFKYGREYLFKDGKYDALGVACFLLEEEGLIDNSWVDLLLPSWNPVVEEYLDGVNEQAVIELSDNYGFNAVAIYLNTIIDEDYDA